MSSSFARAWTAVATLVLLGTFAYSTYNGAGDAIRWWILGSGLFLAAVLACAWKGKWARPASLLTFAGAAVVAATFLWASWHKIHDPPDFAKVIYNYKLVPGEAIHLVAIYLPWFEAIAALAVVSRFGRRGGALALTVICLIFIAALSYNLYRGHPTICGCFNTFAEGDKWTPERKFMLMRREIFLDVGLCLLSVQVLLHGLSAKARERLEPA